MAATKLGGIGDEAVAKRTGKTWKEWIAILDRAGCAKRDHKGIAAWLAARHPSLGGWWTQMVTVGYEQARGLRKKHESPDGFEVSVSRTLPASAAALFRAWKDEAARRRWLPGERIEIRKATPSKSMRVAWSDGKTRLDVNFYPKGPSRAQVVVQHTKLASAAAAARTKKYWSGALDRLGAHLGA